MPWLLSLWFMGVMILVGRLNLGLVAAERLRSAATQPAVEELQEALRELSLRLGVKRSLKLMNSALVEVPTVLGWLQPVILVPLGCLAGLSASQVQALLAHELAHIRRQDYLVNIFQSAVETLLFYHPAVWWVSKQVRQEREHCCDDLAVRISGDTLAYAKALSILEERRASVPVAALGSNGGALTMRIRRLLGCPEPPAISRWLAIPFLAVVLIAGGLCVGTLAHAAGQQANVKESSELKDLPPEYQKWLEKEVVWIITPEERAAFSQLKTNEERDMFVEQFWLRRNPTPNSKENPFKEEHYRRLAFANLHFAAKNTPGWKTDRGRIYIVYGPPDQINSYPAGDSSASGKPTDIWTYRLIREHGRDRKDVVMQFVDVNGDGEYPLQSPGKKD
jgi:GWxTD domain-containing protein